MGKSPLDEFIPAAVRKPEQVEPPVGAAASDAALTVRKVKTFMGMDTYGFNCELLFKGKLVAQVVNDGGGGETEYRWVNRDCRFETAVLEYAKLLPMPGWAMPGKDFPEGIDDKTGSLRLDDVVESAMAKLDFEKKIRRHCKKKTCFQLPEDGEDGFRSLSIPWGPKAKQFLDKQFPGQKLTILNEVYT